jgi:sulfate/thiosulfate transport system permease protein
MASTAVLARKYTIVPGFRATFAYTVVYLLAIVVIPLSALVGKAFAQPWKEFWATVSDPRTVNACTLTFGTALAATCVNLIFGSILAWVLVRYSFPGKRLVDSLIDIPFALPTAVSGIALTAVYAKTGWLGQILEPLGIQAAYSRLGIVIALVFVGLPFIVRAVQPALQDLDPALEEAAALLGAGRWTVIRRVLIPTVRPALISGFATAFARALGEYGSVVFISGNMPMKTEIASLLIMAKLEQFDYAGAAAIGFLTLSASLTVLILINSLQKRLEARYEGR